MGERVRAQNLDFWVERQGRGPEVLIISGLADPVEAWQFQLDGLQDRYRLTAYDNRGVGRTPMGEEPLTVPAAANDAAALLEALGVPAAHVVGHSVGGVIAQELALRHPQLVRSLVLVSTWARLDAYFRATLNVWRWLAEVAPSERAFFEAFFLWVYTPRAHANGLVEQIIQGALAFPHKMSTQAVQRWFDTFAYETADRLAKITAPTLVLSGGLDRPATPQFGQLVAEGIPGARFKVLPEEAHRPFTENPKEFNARVDAFWHDIETRGSA
jgi:pimeloyl-ACP methyl ester carboxylesterase